MNVTGRGHAATGPAGWGGGAPLRGPSPLAAVPALRPALSAAWQTRKPGLC